MSMWFCFDLAWKLALIKLKKVVTNYLQGQVKMASVTGKF